MGIDIQRQVLDSNDCKQCFVGIRCNVRICAIARSDVIPNVRAAIASKDAAVYEAEGVWVTEDG